ncbi:MAG: FAD-binding oxidoreductase [Candidatus Aminicenantes bacterium]|nr:FAD-binding oxidoreductase [Candidatus Aminicenantes bacterium]
MTTAPVANASYKNIVIIGGGVTGVLSAWELARMGAKVILVEARHLGSGASSRSAACIRAQFETLCTVQGMLYSINFFKHWTDIIENSQSPIRQNGYLFLKNYMADVEAVKRQVTMQQKAGLKEVEWLDEAALSEHFPYIDTIGIVGGTWCPKDGFLFPNIIYQDCSQAARKLGVEIIQNDPVVKAEISGSKAIAVILNSGRRIEADVFLNTANVWAPGISRLFGGIDLPITAERRYLYFLDGLKKDSDWGLKMADFPSLPMIVTPYGAYCRPENQQIMMGWLQHAKPATPTLDNQDDIEPGFGLGFNEYGSAVRKEITQFLPAVQDMGRLVAVTTGFYDTTPDHNPLFGYDLNIHNLIHAAGFSGHGLMHAPFSARIVAELINAGHNIETINLPYDIGRVGLKHLSLNRTFEYFEGMVI